MHNVWFFPLTFGTKNRKKKKKRRRRRFETFHWICSVRKSVCVCVCFCNTKDISNKIYQWISDERIRFECACLFLSPHSLSLLFISVLALERFKSAYIVRVSAPSPVNSYATLCVYVFFRFGFWNI